MQYALRFNNFNVNFRVGFHIPGMRTIPVHVSEPTPIVATSRRRPRRSRSLRWGSAFSPFFSRRCKQTTNVPSIAPASFGHRRRRHLVPIELHSCGIGQWAGSVGVLLRPRGMKCIIFFFLSVLLLHIVCGRTVCVLRNLILIGCVAYWSFRLWRHHPLLLGNSYIMWKSAIRVWSKCRMFPGRFGPRNSSAASVHSSASGQLGGMGLNPNPICGAFDWVLKLLKPCTGRGQSNRNGCSGRFN